MLKTFQWNQWNSITQNGVPGTKCNTKNPKPAANTIDTEMIRRPDAIPPSLNAIWLVIFKLIIATFFTK